MKTDPETSSPTKSTKYKRMNKNNRIDKSHSVVLKLTFLSVKHTQTVLALGEKRRFASEAAPHKCHTILGLDWD